MQVILLCVSLQAEEERVNRAKRLEQEERIAKELSRIKYEREREEKMRQYIRENRYSVGYHALIGVTVQIMCCGFLITIPSTTLKAQSSVSWRPSLSLLM